MSNDFNIPRPLLGAPFDKRVTADWLQANQNAPMRPFNEDVDIDLIDEVNRVVYNLYRAIVDLGYLSLPGGFNYALSLFKKTFPGISFTIKAASEVTKNYRFYFGNNYSSGQIVETTRWIAPASNTSVYEASHKAAADRAKLRQQPNYVKFSVLQQDITLHSIYTLFFVNRFTYLDDNPLTYGEEFGLQTADARVFILNALGDRVFESEYKRVTSNEGQLLLKFPLELKLVPGEYRAGIEMTNLSPTASADSPYFCSIVPATDDPSFSNLISELQAQSDFDIEEVRTGFISYHRSVYLVDGDTKVDNWDYSFTFEFSSNVLFPTGFSALIGSDVQFNGQVNAYLINAAGVMTKLDDGFLPKQKLTVEFTIPVTPVDVLANAFTIDLAVDSSHTDFSLEFMEVPRFVRYAGETRWHVEGTEYLIRDSNLNKVFGDIWLNPGVKYRAEFEFRYQTSQKENAPYGTPGAYYRGYWVFLTGLFEADTGDYITGGPAFLWCNTNTIALMNTQRLNTMNPRFVFREPGPIPKSIPTYLYDERGARMYYAPPAGTTEKIKTVPILIPHPVTIHKWVEERGA